MEKLFYRNNISGLYRNQQHFQQLKTFLGESLTSQHRHFFPLRLRHHLQTWTLLAFAATCRRNEQTPNILQCCNCLRELQLRCSVHIVLIQILELQVLLRLHRTTFLSISLLFCRKVCFVTERNTVVCYLCINKTKYY